MHLLIPYIQLDEVDPDFDEFSYGDAGSRGKKLLTKVKKGDYVFFHTTIHRTKLITAYYVVDRCVRVSDARENCNIMTKYRNPHLHRERIIDEHDMVLLGDPIESRRLGRPLVFDRKLAKKLGLGIEFRKGVTESQAIGSATRSWRELSQEDVELLLDEIKESQEAGADTDRIYTTEEVAEIIEKDLENFIVQEREVFGRGLRLIARQLDTPVGRIDLLFENKRGDSIVVELKMGRIGRDAISQLHRYMDYLKKKGKGEVRGIVVCEGVLPAFENEFAKGLENIKIYHHGWQLAVKEW